MVLRKLSVAALTLALGLSATGVRADDPAPAKVDNPLFTAWSKFEVGASVTQEADVAAPDGTKVHVVSTDTLKEKTADTIKVESVGKVGDQAEPNETDTYPAKVDAEDAKSTGDEDVKIADKTYKCKVYEVAGTVAGKPKEERATIYCSDEVPGGIVKAIFHLPGGKDVTEMMTSMKAK